MASSHPRLRPVLRSLTVMLGPPLLLKLALVVVLVPWLQDHGRPGRLLANQRLLLHGHALVQRSLHRPLAPALELVRQQRLLALQQQLEQGDFHGCYQQSRDALLHVIGRLQTPAVAPDRRPRRFRLQVAGFRRNLDGRRRYDDATA